MDGLMDKRSTIRQIEIDGRRLIDAARDDLDARVPTCGDWAQRDLLGHIGFVHALVARNLIELPTAPLTLSGLDRAPDDDSVVDYASAALDRLLVGLSGVEPDTPVWNWSHDHTAGFYFRRMLHETSVHRWDAENAVGGTGKVAGVAGEQGRDGVDEFFDHVIPNAQRRKRRQLPSGSLHLHRTDGEGEWLVHSTPEGDVVVQRIHAKGDAAVRATGGELFLALWNRLPLSELEVFGDADTARAWTSLAP